MDIKDKLQVLLDTTIEDYPDASLVHFMAEAVEEITRLRENNEKLKTSMINHWYEEDLSCTCGKYTSDGSWCDECLDDVDIEAHEEQRRERMREQNEY